MAHCTIDAHMLVIIYIHLCDLCFRLYKPCNYYFWWIKFVSESCPVLKRIAGHTALQNTARETKATT